MNPGQFNSTNQSVAAVTGTNTAGGPGVVGTGHTGVVGESKDFVGVSGISHDPNNAGVMGVNDNGGWGVTGRSSTNTGVSGESVSGVGVHGAGHTGVLGESRDFVGVSGLSHDRNNAGVMGVNDNGGWGVTGRSSTNTGVSGESVSGVGVHGKGGKLAGLFDGAVNVNGELFVDGKLTISGNGDLILQGGDCAENFDIFGPAVVPGTVMVIGAGGGLEACHEAYDRKVVGVVSGAGSLRPGILLDCRDTAEGRQPVALVGKVYCQVDAEAAPIMVGDLLTTSALPGYAMKAVDERRAFGALLGKALAPLPSGRGLIPVLVALQ
jgi:hypothetical protein